MSVRCFKCKDDMAIVASREGSKKSYCRTCFLDIYHRNVRDTFFRQCRVPPEVPIILAVSGGVNSMAMMHSLGLLRVQNMSRGGAGKIYFNMHVLHLTGDDEDEGNHCAQTASAIVKACCSTAPVDHVPQATTTKRRVAEKKGQAEGKPTPTTAQSDPVPLFEPYRVHVRKLSDYIPSYESIGNTFFGQDTPNSKSLLTSVAMAEDLVTQLRQKALVAAASSLATELASNGTDMESGKNRHTEDAKFEAPYVMLVGDSAVCSAVGAMYQLVRGRGQSIVEQSGYKGSLYLNAVPIRRPMRGLLPKENFFYCLIESLPTFWSAVPLPKQSSGGRITKRLLQYCVSSATIHRDLSYIHAAAVKSALGLTFSPKQKASIKSLLENFVLQLSETSYRSAIFNILNSVDKMTTSDEDSGKKDSKQLRFGPKNASVFSEDEKLCSQTPHCSFCGGEVSQRPSNTWMWCRSCSQVLRPIFTNGEDVSRIDNELCQFLQQPKADSATSSYIKMSSEDVKAQIAEYLLDDVE